MTKINLFQKPSASTLYHKFQLSTPNFIWNRKKRNSTSGTSSYAIIFMDKFEGDFLSKYPLIPLIWWRYIDDIFMIWPHTREELYSFINSLNTCHPTLRFTQSKRNISGVSRWCITKNNHGDLQTSLYSIPTDAHLYSRSRQYGAHASTDLYFDIESSKYNTTLKYWQFYYLLLLMTFVFVTYLYQT